MCLETTEEITEDFRKTYKDKEFIWCYKIYNISYLGGKKKLYSPYYYKGRKIFPGAIHSDRGRLEFDASDNTSYSNNKWRINKGIHVYTNKSIAKTAHYHLLKRVNCVLVRVKCLMSEFVGYDEIKKEAVFRSIELSQKEYNKAIEETKCV